MRETRQTGFAHNKLMQKVGCTQQVDNTIQLTSIFLRAQTHLNEQHSPSLELRKTNANTLAKGNAAAHIYIYIYIYIYINRMCINVLLYQCVVCVCVCVCVCGDVSCWGCSTTCLLRAKSLSRESKLWGGSLFPLFSTACFKGENIEADGKL